MKTQNSCARNSIASMAQATLTLLLLTGCGLLTPKPLPVAVSCPPFPDPPRAVVETSALTEKSLLEEWNAVFSDYLKATDDSMKFYVEGLKQSFDEAMKGSASRPSAAPGR